MFALTASRTAHVRVVHRHLPIRCPLWRKLIVYPVIQIKERNVYGQDELGPYGYGALPRHRFRLSGLPLEWFWRAIGVLVILTSAAVAHERTQIDFPSRTPLGLVGNGSSIVKVRPSGFDFFEGGNAVGRFRLLVGGKPYELQADEDKIACSACSQPYGKRTGGSAGAFSQW